MKNMIKKKSTKRRAHTFTRKRTQIKQKTTHNTNTNK